MCEQYIEGGAIVSKCEKYRYALTRIWDEKLPVLTWVMLNPSTADADEDDATIRKCVEFSKRWGYGGIHVVNLFALRATNPKELLKARDPFGQDNIIVLGEAFQNGRDFLVAWGNNVLKTKNADIIMKFVAETAEHHVPQNYEDEQFWKRFWCLGLTKQRQPRHPLMLSYKTKRVLWKP
jgi:hypothetical protein